MGSLLKSKQGPVAIALTGTWDEKEIKLNAPSNHAKIGVSTSGSHHYVIFGDLNQQGALSPPTAEKSERAGRVILRARQQAAGRQRHRFDRRRHSVDQGQAVASRSLRHFCCDAFFARTAAHPGSRPGRLSLETLCQRTLASRMSR